MSRIFCPNCSTLLLAATRCPACGWSRPPMPGPGQEVWRIALSLSHGRTAYAPVSAAGVWWLPSESGDLLGVESRTGRWRRVIVPEARGCALALAAAGDLLIVSLADTQPIPSGGRPLLALEGSSGDEVWRYATDAHSLSAATLADETIYFTTSSGRLHALSAAGEPRWSAAHPAWGPAAPAVAEGVVVAGGREPIICGYNAADGRPLWRAEADAWLAGPLAIAGGRVFSLAFDGSLLAFDLRSGARLWRVKGERANGFTSPPAALGERVFIGDRVSGAGGRTKGYALRALRAADGAELGRAALRRHLQVPPVIAGDPGQELLLCCADDGLCQALDPADLEARWSYSAGQQFIAAPLAVGGLAVLAVEDGVAAVQLRAEQAHSDPRALIAAGELAEAAEHYALAGELERAAELYGRAGGHREAALLYERAGQPGEAAQHWERAGDAERARQGYEQAGDLKAAAASYERGGELARALALYRAQGAWAEVAALAARLDLPAEEAAAYERLGADGQAAAAYERAARQAIAAGEDGQDAAAELLVHAAALYEQSGDAERARACREELGQVRRIPDLMTVVRPRFSFVEQEWNELDVEVRNVGFGPARAVSVRVGGPPFDGSGASVFQLIAPGETQRSVVRLRPKAGEVGPGVPLTLTTNFQDSRGQPYEEREEVSLRVTARGSVAQPAPELAITAGGGRGSGAERRLPLESLELPLTLRFDAPDASGLALVRWEAETIGSLTSSFRPPYSGDDLALVIAALDELQSARRGFSAAELARLAALGLPVEEGILHAQAHQAVGRAIFTALTADPEGDKALATIRNVAVAQSRAAVVRLHFAPAAASLAALPWELAWDESDEPLLLSRGQLIGCVRHLDLAQALPPPRARGGPLRLTAVTPAAGLDPAARAEERAARLAALEPLIQRGELRLDEVAGPVTRRALNEHFREHGPPDIVHFVGHGRYLDGRGYLVLDTPEGGYDPAPAAQIVQLFSQARLVVLHACQSATSSETGLLTGVAPALSAAGVPAVVAMQLTVRVAAAIRFAEELYGALGRGESLQRAVSLGRQVLYSEERDGASWYVPTLTVRARDPGPLYLFESVGREA